MGGALTLRWNLASDVELRSITGYREVSVDQWDNSGGAHRPPIFSANGLFSRYSLSYLEQNQFSQELQAVGRLAGQLDYVFGLYYFREKAFEEAATPSTTAGTPTAQPTPSSIPAPDRAVSAGSRAAEASTGQPGAIEEHGRLRPADLDPTVRRSFHFTLGGRYTREHKSGTLYKVNNAATAFGFDQRTSRFNPLAILAWDATSEHPPLREICDRLSLRRRQLALAHLPRVRTRGRQELRGRRQDRALRPPPAAERLRLHDGPQRHPGRFQRPDPPVQRLHPQHSGNGECAGTTKIRGSRSMPRRSSPTI